MELSNEQRQQITDKLTLLEGELEEEIKETKIRSQPVELDQQAVGRVSRVDAIQQQQMQLASLQRLERRLQLVRAAQSRIDAEDFGLCANCEEPIEWKRLLAVPESPICIDCASKAGK